MSSLCTPEFLNRFSDETSRGPKGILASDFILADLKGLLHTRRRRTNLNRVEDTSPAEFFASFRSCKSYKSRQREEKQGFMKKLIHSENSRAFIIAVALTCFALLPEAHAVVPAPDGGYSGGNTAEGQNALFSLTTGGFNTAVGYFSLRNDTTGAFNTAVGAGALLANTADSNTAAGVAALFSNTTGSDNTAAGTLALFSNTTGGDNTASGKFALFSNTTGNSNVAMGSGALGANVTGNFNTAAGDGALGSNNADSNTAVGASALSLNTTGHNDTATGVSALESNTTGSHNTAVGDLALASNNADGNTAVGSSALSVNTTGGSNTALGNVALSTNTIGNENTAVGAVALQFSTTGSRNTAIGHFALSVNGTASNNTGVGDLALGFNSLGNGNTVMGADALCCATAGDENTVVGDEAVSMVFGDVGSHNTAIGSRALLMVNGSNNVAVGFNAGANQTTGSNNVYIGEGIQGVAGESDTCRIKSIFGQTAANGSTVFITSGNKLGTDTSSKRFKEDIKPMDDASEALLALKPVTFRYRKEIDPESKSQFGLVAEDVEKVDPDLVVRDKEGKPYSVRYDQVNAMLLNEFLKEHRKVEKLEAAVAALTSQLRRVSAQLEMNHSGAQVVVSNH
jgi:trimeric autotransporter adhesin